MYSNDYTEDDPDWSNIHLSLAIRIPIFDEPNASFSYTQLREMSSLSCLSKSEESDSIDLDRLLKIAESLWKLCLNRHKVLSEHIAGLINVIADRTSRMGLDHHDWKDIFNRIWGLYQLDFVCQQDHYPSSSLLFVNSRSICRTDGCLPSGTLYPLSLTYP